MVRDEELARRLVVRRGSRGNRTYAAEAKRELVDLCRSGVASVAQLAQTYGVNPNLLHNWIALDRKERPACPALPVQVEQATPSPFIPVVQAPAEAVNRAIKLDIALANGIHVNLDGLSRDDVLNLLPTLAGLPCSASTRR